MQLGRILASTAWNTSHARVSERAMYVRYGLRGKVLHPTSAASRLRYYSLQRHVLRGRPHDGIDARLQEYRSRFAAGWPGTVQPVPAFCTIPSTYFERDAWLLRHAPRTNPTGRSKGGGHSVPQGRGSSAGADLVVSLPSCVLHGHTEQHPTSLDTHLRSEALAFFFAASASSFARSMVALSPSISWRCRRSAAVPPPKPAPACALARRPWTWVCKRITVEIDKRAPRRHELDLLNTSGTSKASRAESAKRAKHSFTKTGPSDSPPAISSSHGAPMQSKDREDLQIAPTRGGAGWGGRPFL